MDKYSKIIDLLNSERAIINEKIALKEKEFVELQNVDNSLNEYIANSEYMLKIYKGMLNRCKNNNKTIFNNLILKNIPLNIMFSVLIFLIAKLGFSIISPAFSTLIASLSVIFTSPIMGYFQYKEIKMETERLKKNDNNDLENDIIMQQQTLDEYLGLKNTMILEKSDISNELSRLRELLNAIDEKLEVSEYSRRQLQVDEESSELVSQPLSVEVLEQSSEGLMIKSLRVNEE